MDWIDPRYKSGIEEDVSTSGPKQTRVATKRKAKHIKRGKPLGDQVTAALAQPLDVWSSAFDHAVARLKWPQGCSCESTFLFSVVMQEQAEALVRTGVSAKKLAAIIHDGDLNSAGSAKDSVSEVVGLMDQTLQSLAFSWLDTADTYAHAALAVSALAWNIPDHAKRAGNDWLSQWLQAASDRCAQYKPDLEEPVICHLVFQCELPLLIGVATSASKRTALAEASKAMDNLAEYLECSQESPASWLVHGATYLRASLACVLRCRILANSLGLRKWYPPQQKALANLLKHAARWSRPNGTQLLAAGHKSPKAKCVWDALTKQTRRPKSMRWAMSLSGIGEESRSKVLPKARAASLPELTFYSENASGVCMRSDWRHKGGHVAVDFSDTEICIEALGAKGQSIIAGDWRAQVELNGQAQLQLDEWGELCWFSDDDVDYLELEARFGKHARIQRQAALFREERLLLLADTLLCDKKGDWCVRSHIPLDVDAQFSPAKKSHEGFITLPDGNKCLTLPLFLPEWRRQPAAGSLTTQEQNIVAQHSCSDSQRLYMPTLISLCGSHATKPFTWRQLTIGEELRIVGGDEACAYRAQIDRDQWLIYRTLAPAARRTVLGMHTLADFYAGRFDPDDGAVDAIVEVDPAS